MRAALTRALVILLLACGVARADSVAQVQTAKQITRETVDIIQPLRAGVPRGAGDNVNIAPGQVLTFRIRFTPVPNGATRGLGGYITEYVPQNTEVVGARIVDKDGNTVPPHRGGLAQDGVGPRGTRNYPLPLLGGSLSQLYADTGVFFSTDPRTARTPTDQFITVDNGIPMNPAPTGAGQLDGLLGVAGAVHAHNEWDALHAQVFGAGDTFFVDDNGTLRSFNHPGTGNTPFGYGSAVAGPETFYPFEISLAQDGSFLAGNVTGPWRRVKTPGAEIGTGAAVTGAGPIGRVGIPADDLGRDVSVTNPLPSIANPDVDGRFTTAVRFAVGELVVGDEYFAEISLRVIGLPLDPLMNQNVNCAEVFGGDASAFNQTSGGKDNTWRYFVPSPSCVQLDLFFELAVDKLVAISGDTVTYTIEGKNLSINTQTNVIVTDTLGPGTTFVSASNGGVFANGKITWPAMNLAPADTYLFTVQVKIGANSGSTLNTATYVSDQIPAPGFSVVALTDLGELVVMDQALSASPDQADPGGAVHYTGTVTNRGTGTLSFGGCNAPACAVAVTLPAGFVYRAGSAKANGAAIPDATIAGTIASFAGPFPDVDPGQALKLEFDVDIDAGVAPGLYTSTIQVFAKDASFGKQIEGETADTAPVLVGLVRSDTPVIVDPVIAGATSVSGTTTEADGTEIRLFINDVLRGTATSANGGWIVSGLPALFAGQQLRAVAQNTAAGEFESFPSLPVFVTNEGAGPQDCNDGVDNDGDGLTDFPADPGCASPDDPNEDDRIGCSDGIDNDGDGLIDFPDDPGCLDLNDEDEADDPGIEGGGCGCQVAGEGAPLLPSLLLLGLALALLRRRRARAE